MISKRRGARDQIARTEDQRFGFYYALELGWSMPALGADRNAALLHVEASHGWRLGSDILAVRGRHAQQPHRGRVSDRQPVVGSGLRYYLPNRAERHIFRGRLGCSQDTSSTLITS